MMSKITGLVDDAARVTALAGLDRSLLVEAGAGSGKTAVMAGRIAMLLVQGTAPASIAAVTFTELAASELLFRVRGFVAALRDGDLPPELRIALPTGLSPGQRAHLALAATQVDDIACSTIHGFCQRLILPYPVEADIDPGAAVMDAAQADQVLADLTQAWLREQLAVADGGVVAALAVDDLAPTLALVEKIVAQLRQHRDLTAHTAKALAPLVLAFQDASAALQQFMADCGVEEPETKAIAGHFADLAALPALVSFQETPLHYLPLLTCVVHKELYTGDNEFRVFSKKGKWEAAGKVAGLLKAERAARFEQASGHYATCCHAWSVLREQAATAMLALLVDALRPLLVRYQAYKRDAALLDFDDLIVSARNLLRDHPAVRAALSARYTHVLVDEFQDTDAMQSEIFWRLCGDAPAGAADADWPAWRIRPGALFLVGDPKQAIYRFRGADVAAYVQARAAFVAHDPGSLLSIATNFRSRAPILEYVNALFGPLLSAAGQPGFTALAPFHAAPGELPCVVALDVAAGAGASSEQHRDAEAEAVAAACAAMIGQLSLPDQRGGPDRLCRPGDIALLAPGRSELWRYENALERRGIPVASQAGKGFYRRQEVQDLIALTRVLADRADTLALGALLRGPLVGLTEEALLDLVWALPRDEEDPSALPKLDVGIDPQLVAHPVARAVLETLQTLRRGASGSTPHHVLSQAIDALRMRLIVQQRYAGKAERALANIDQYLGMSQAYASRGLAAFALAMSAAWKEGAKTVEGRPDAQEEAVALVTMHSAKGLEWPVVMPINTMTAFKAADGGVRDRQTGHFHSKVCGISPAGHEAALAAEKAAVQHERVRVWYVAATRARELLVLPRADVAVLASTWIGLLGAPLAGLPALALTEAAAAPLRAATHANAQTAGVFADEAAGIAARQLAINWHAPSRVEADAQGALPEPEPAGWIEDDAGAVEATDVAAIQGGRERGLLIHKLLEEVLNGECGDAQAALLARAEVLLLSLGLTPAALAGHALVPAELAACVARTLQLPEIVDLRPRLLAEYPVYASTLAAGEQVSVGVADAIALDAQGAADVVVDWKSDVAPTPATLAHYAAQVRQYLDMTGARRGLVVLVTSGKVLPVFSRESV